MSEPSTLPRRRMRRADATAARLRREIAGGRFERAEVLPGERALADLFQVSRTTLRQALADLAAEGLLSQRHGLGTIITRQKEPLVSKKPLVQECRSFDFIPEDRVYRELARGLALPTGDEAMILAVPPGAALFRLTRLLLQDEVIVGIEHQAAPCRFLEDPAPQGGTVLDALARQGHRPARTLRRLTSVRAAATEAKVLEVDAGSLAIARHDASYLADGRCCALVRALHRADRMDLMFDADSQFDGRAGRA